MIKNKTDNTLKVDLGPGSGWTTEFKADDYGMSVRLFAGDKLKTFIRFKPNDLAAMQEFLEEQASRWDKEEI